MTNPRVLVVEDDVSVRRFIQMTLDPLEVELVHCATLAEARSALELAGASVVITDLSLPDGPGQELLAWMQARTTEPAAAHPSVSACRAVVFSGGIEAAVERQLAALGVWRVLRKPSSVGALMECVSEALASVAEAAAVSARAKQDAQHPADAFFGGNRALYETYRQSCRAQFGADLAAGDAALAASDAEALRHVAHNLKSVLALLGEADAAACARQVEEWAAARSRDALAQGWQRLRAQVARLI